MVAHWNHYQHIYYTKRVQSNLIYQRLTLVVAAPLPDIAATHLRPLSTCQLVVPLISQKTAELGKCLNRLELYMPLQISLYYS